MFLFPCVPVSRVPVFLSFRVPLFLRSRLDVFLSSYVPIFLCSCGPLLLLLLLVLLLLLLLLLLLSLVRISDEIISANTKTKRTAIRNCYMFFLVAWITILAEGAIALSVTLSGGALFAS